MTTGGWTRIELPSPIDVDTVGSCLDAHRISHAVYVGTVRPGAFSVTVPADRAHEARVLLDACCAAAPRERTAVDDLTCAVDAHRRASSSPISTAMPTRFHTGTVHVRFAAGGDDPRE